jgi:hypothetical protein
MLLLHLRVPEPPPVYIDLSLVDLPELAPEESDSPADEMAVEEDQREPLAEEDDPIRAVSDPTRQAQTGVKEGLNWVTGPPKPAQTAPLELTDRTLRANGILRRSLMAGVPVTERAPSALDTLVFVQQRLAMIAEDALEWARNAPKGDRFHEPIPQSGSIQELRGGGMLPIVPLAGIVAGKLVEIGKGLWDRLTNRNPGAETRPDMDLTYAQVLAYAALDDYEGYDLFEWYGGLHEDVQGGLGELQDVAADLSDRNLIRLRMTKDRFEYRRIVPLRDVVDYYVSYLSRMRQGDPERRNELIQKVSALVRYRRLP